MARPSNKEAIVRAALECFAEKGYDGTRIADIAERAGVSVAALYNHYPSVQSLAQELYLQHFGAYAAELAEIVNTEGESVAARASRVVRATMARYRADPAAFTFVSQRIASFITDLPAEIELPLTSLERLVAEGQRAGEVRAGSPVLIATLFLGALLRVFLLAEFADMHSFTLSEAHDPTIEAACLAVLRPDEVCGA